MVWLHEPKCKNVDQNVPRNFGVSQNLNDAQAILLC